MGDLLVGSGAVVLVPLPLSPARRRGLQSVAPSARRSRSRAAAFRGRGRSDFPAGRGRCGGGFGVIGFTALAQGPLTGRCPDGGPRAAAGTSFGTGWPTDDALHRLRALKGIAARRRQALAQMAPARALRDPRVTSPVIGASRTEQPEQNVAALENLDLGAGEPAEIDAYATEGGVDLWCEARPGTLGRAPGAARGVRRRGRGTAVR